MYKHADIRSGRTRRLGASVGALVVSAALLSFGTGIAYADDTSEVKPDTTAAEGPAIKDGVRASGAGEVAATQGVVRNSEKAVPGTKGQSLEPNPMETGWNCEFVWTKLCA